MHPSTAPAQHQPLRGVQPPAGHPIPLRQEVVQDLRAPRTAPAQPPRSCRPNDGARVRRRRGRTSPAGSTPLQTPAVIARDALRPARLCLQLPRCGVVRERTGLLITGTGLLGGAHRAAAHRAVPRALWLRTGSTVWNEAGKISLNAASTSALPAMGASAPMRSAATAAAASSSTVESIRLTLGVLRPARRAAPAPARPRRCCRAVFQRLQIDAGEHLPAHGRAMHVGSQPSPLQPTLKHRN